MTGARVARLDDLAAIDVSGEDAAAFLHAQFCGDVLGLPDGRCLFTAWCDPKGRVIASFLLARGASGFRIVLRRDLAAATLKKLRLYVLRSRVEFVERSDVVLAGRYGADAGGTSPGPGVELPWEHVDESRLSASALPGEDGPRILFSGPTAALSAFSADPAQAPGWTLQDVQAGMAWIGAPLAGEFLPQEIDLERLGGLSYTKGCYPGQEIVARVRSRGRLKRGLHRFAADGEPPATGTPVVDAGGRPAGRVIAAAAVAAGHRGLAVCDLEPGARDALHLHRPGGPILRFDARPD